MAIFDNTRPTSHGFLFGTRFVAMKATVANAFTAWNDTRATHKALAQLSDLQLDDIGLTRSDISNL